MRKAPTLSAYYGGKASHRKYLLPIFEKIPHQIYVECFGGTAALMLAKPARPREVYNDLDGALVALLRCIRTRPDELAREIALTPYARDEYRYCAEQMRKPDLPEMEKARCAWALLKTSFSSILAAGGFSTGGAIYSGNIALQLHNTAEFAGVAVRLAGVVIENNDWYKVFKLHDHAKTLIYLDPPYHPDRRSSRGYRLEWKRADHLDLVEKLLQAKGAVVLSGYDHPDYAPLEAAGWLRLTYRIGTMQKSKGKGKIVAEESVWLSPMAAAAYQTQDLFSTLTHAAA